MQSLQGSRAEPPLDEGGGGGGGELCIEFCSLIIC